MELITGTNYWNCALAAAAMTMDVELDDLIELIGHDGSEIINPDYKDPANRKGFHMQEIISAAIELGFAVTPIEARPVQKVFEDDNQPYEVYTLGRAEKRFQNHLLQSKGILVGLNPSGLYHAVAWDGEEIYDPVGRIYKPDSCKVDIKIFWCFDEKSKSNK